VVQRTSKRILRFIQRRGVISLVAGPGDGEVIVVGDESMGEKDPLLARLLAAATAGAPPAGWANKGALPSGCDSVKEKRRFKCLCSRIWTSLPRNRVRSLSVTPSVSDGYEVENKMTRLAQIPFALVPLLPRFCSWAAAAAVETTRTWESPTAPR